MSAGASGRAVRVVGIVRGREIDATAAVFLDDDALVLAWPAAAPWRVLLHGIDGVRTTIDAAATTLTVYLRDHDVLELTGDDHLRSLSATLVDRACRIPELTRGLREFGAVRGGASRVAVRANGRSPLHVAHDLWFAPLLDARRAVHGVSDPVRQVTLLDGRALHEAMLGAAAAIAASLASGDAAEQRALEAAIEDEAAPLFAALEQLARTGDALRHGQSDTCLADWRHWVAAAKRVYEEADEAWGEIAAIVGES